MICDDIGVRCEVKTLTENRIRKAIIERLRGIYDTLQSGDELIITEVDSLGRNKQIQGKMYANCYKIRLE